jgi:hypothetical protein
VARSIKPKVSFKKSSGADKIVAGRINDARRLVAKQVVEEAAEVVRGLIPNQGGWYSIYREAITYFSVKGGDLWAVSGLWPKDYSEFPADTTLIDFTAHQGNKVEEGLASYNPWTVDQLPPLNGGIRAEAKAKPASAAEVEAQRQRLLDAAVAIKKLLTDAGASYVNEPPTIMGKVYADVAFMATCLEHGLAGLPRIPHWVKALRQVQNDARDMVSPIKADVEAVLGGKETFDAKGEAMPPGLEQKLGL